MCGAPALPVFGVDLSFLCAAGYFGVDLFFVLSGFLLGPPLQRALHEHAWRPAMARFWRHRMRRVLPAYWVQLAVLTVLAVVAGREFAHPWLTAVSHLSLTTNLFPYEVVPLNRVYWSLPVEWDFYVVLPLIALLATRVGMLRMVGVAFAVSLLFRVACLDTVFEVPPQSWMSWWAGSIHQLPARLDQFLLGMLAAHLAARDRLTARGNTALLGAVLLALAATAWAIGPRGDVFSRVDAPLVLLQFSWLGTLFAALCLVAAGPGATPRRVLGHPLLIGLGTISYSLYLWHAPLIDAWAHWGGAGTPRPLQLAGLCAWILLVSTLSWRLVERPWQAGWRPAGAARDRAIE